MDNSFIINQSNMKESVNIKMANSGISHSIKNSQPQAMSKPISQAKSIQTYKTKARNIPCIVSFTPKIK